MAEAVGKLTGRPGIAMVTRGPGACHAAVGIHTAFQDSTPLIMLIGQVGRDMMDREVFQEIDYRKMFGPVAKWAAQIDQTDRIPVHGARLPRRDLGPSRSGGAGAARGHADRDGDGARRAPRKPPQAKPDADDLGARELLAKAERPLMLLGGAQWTDEACADIQAFAEACDCPVAVSFRRQDIFDNSSRVHAGDLGTSGPPQLVKRAKEADLLIVVGARLGEMTTQGYTVLDTPEPRQTNYMSIPMPTTSARVHRASLAISRPVGLRDRARRHPPRRVALARLDRGGARRLHQQPRSRRRGQRRARHGPRLRLAARHPAARRDRHRRRRQPHRLAAALSALWPPRPADLQADQWIIRAGGGRGSTSCTGPAGRRRHRRRRPS